MDTLTPTAPAESASALPHTVSAAEDWFRPCVVIVVREFGPALSDTVQALLDDDLPCLLIDDSGAASPAVQLSELARNPAVQLFRHDGAPGTGAAMVRGLQEAARLGYSHAAQVDAHGRDDLARVSLFLDRASQAPDAVICGYPRPAPKAGPFDLSSRCLAHLGELSTGVRTALCDLRVYPLATTLAHALSPRLAGSSDFDSDLLMRMHEQNQPLVWLRTVPPAGFSGRPMAARIGILGIARLLLRAVLR